MKLEPRERRPFVAYEVDLLQFILPKRKVAAAKKAPAAAAKKAPAALTKVPSTASVAARLAAVPALTRKQSIEADRRFREGLSTHKWQYKNDAGKWADYDKAASEEVEKAYANWTVNPHVDVRSVHSGDWDYMIDFNLLTQTNIRHAAHKVRSIQRVPKN